MIRARDTGDLHGGEVGQNDEHHFFITMVYKSEAGFTREITFLVPRLLMSNLGEAIVSVTQGYSAIQDFSVEEKQY
jgi:hypothetical protein